ncbi:major histocompatibility complex class I-related gene protein [Amia ocellicauda]|uniref:major histocompatibility complex class I-related gene protein n=1 Tax=Amia ocellicauda TaxID=2972642 RepID=UPI003463D01C
MLRCVVLGLLCGLRGYCAATHSLRYFYTGSSGMTEFPEFVTVGMVDNEPFTYYDSNICRETPRQDWIAKSVGADYWERNTQISIGDEQTFKVDLVNLPQRFNQTGGVHTSMTMYGCDWDDEDGTTSGFRLEGYDGEDYLAFDLNTLTWVAPVQRALITKHKWDADRGLNENRKNYLTQTCIEWLKKYIDYGRSTLMRRVAPQVSLLQRDPGSPVSCLATGFFPRDIVLSWQRDGQELHEGVESGGVLLPNGDGTYQVRKSLRVSPEDLEGHTYSCLELQEYSSTDCVCVSVPDPVRPSSNLAVIVRLIIAAVLVLIAATVGVVIWKKRSASKNYDAAQTSDSRADGSSDNGAAKA